MRYAPVTDDFLASFPYAQSKIASNGKPCTTNSSVCDIATL